MGKSKNSRKSTSRKAAYARLVLKSGAGEQRVVIRRNLYLGRSTTNGRNSVKPPDKKTKEKCAK